MAKRSRNRKRKRRLSLNLKLYAEGQTASSSPNTLLPRVSRCELDPARPSARSCCLRGKGAEKKNPSFQCNSVAIWYPCPDRRAHPKDGRYLAAAISAGDPRRASSCHWCYPRVRPARCAASAALIGWLPIPLLRDHPPRLSILHIRVQTTKGTKSLIGIFGSMCLITI